MNKKWDSAVPTIEVWQECLRVLKPGGYILAFGGARTYHRLATYIEDAGFDIREMCIWLYGEGFPKSLNISKQIDKMAGVEREIVGENLRLGDKKTYSLNSKFDNAINFNSYQTLGNITKPTTAQAKQWDGWGTALKPAHEPIVMARKPLAEPTVAQNVLKYGTGGINIDESRIAVDLDGEPSTSEKTGRYPSNLIHDGSKAVESVFPYTHPAGNIKPVLERDYTASSYKMGIHQHNPNYYPGDKGSASRYFYCAKASQEDRDENVELNHHTTVKPTALMRYLIKLVTQPNGIVLDPFMGSGSTGKACMKERLTFIGIEKEEDYFNIAKTRIVNDIANHELF